VEILCFMGWSGTKSTITEAAKWPIIPALDDDGGRVWSISGMLGKGN
jgi:hypothetical protein